MRKVERVVVPADFGRDAGKTFEVTEKSAMEAEKWAWRLALAVKGTSAQIPEAIAPLGYVAIAIRGINSLLAADVDFARIEPLLDEMMACVQIVRNPAGGSGLATPLVGTDDIEEVRTISWLRSEVLRIHTNFSFTDAFSTWAAMMTVSTESSSPNTQTSPPSSA